MKIKTRRYYLYYLLRITFFLLSLVPLRAALVFAGVCGRLAYIFLPKYRRIAIENLRRALNGSEEETEQIAQRVFVNLAKNGAEWMKLTGPLKLDLDKIVTEVEGKDLLEEAHKGGKGVLVLTGHFGNWELVALSLRKMGYTGSAIARRIYFHKYDQFITGLRGRYDVSVLYRDQSVKKFLRVLKNGQVLGMLADQDIDSIDGMFVDYFGRPCYTPTAPVKLAVASGAKMVMVFMVRKEDDTHKMVVRDLLDPASEKGDLDAVKRYTRKWTDVFEEMVRDHPGQWVWIHKRWKTKK